jgi:crotonobetainyl-CoA:carnitine CoA-transferase CaiB-like acyl-CoA transferase
VWVRKYLGDLGANVIKIERPVTGDDSRSWSPPTWEGESVTFLALNRNKRSLVLDYKTKEERESCWRLVGQADVLIQNLRPGALARAGFSADTLRQLNPRLIYCEMSGYGLHGVPGPWILPTTP